MEAAAGRGVLWGQWRQASAFAGCDSKVSEQVWELYGNVYGGSWLIICPARSPGELLEVRASSARRFRITDGLSVRRCASPAQRGSTALARSKKTLGLAWLGFKGQVK